MKNAMLLAAAVLVIPLLADAATPPQTVVLKTGEKVIGEVLKRTEKQIVVDSPAVGTVTIDAANVEGVLGADGKAQPFVAVADPGLFGTGVLSGWERQFEAGATGTAGTTDSTSINVQFNALTDNDRYRSAFGAYYFLTTDNNSTSRNQTRVFASYDKILDGGPWFVFGRAQYDNDSNQLWENRASAFVGPGYEFVKNDRYELLGRIGLGYTVEFGGNIPSGYDDSRFEALIGIDGKWQIDENQRFTYSSYYYPSLDNFAYGRVVSDAAYEADLNKRHGIAVRVGVEHMYDFITPGDDDHNNWKYFFNLVKKL